MQEEVVLLSVNVARDDHLLLDLCVVAAVGHNDLLLYHGVGGGHAEQVRVISVPYQGSCHVWEESYLSPSSLVTMEVKAGYGRHLWARTREEGSVRDRGGEDQG